MQEGPGVENSVTRFLDAWRAGDDQALDRLTPLIYDDLRRLARGYLRAESDRDALQPTALVHEFYLRTPGLRDINWQSRGQFIAAAAKVMRNVMVDHARKRRAAKRGGRVIEVAAEPLAPEPSLDVLEVHRALDRLAVEYPRHAEVVELMFFGGLNAGEASEVLEACGRRTSQRTVERDWRFARGWLYRELRTA